MNWWLTLTHVVTCISISYMYTHQMTLPVHVLGALCQATRRILVWDCVCYNPSGHRPEGLANQGIQGAVDSLHVIGVHCALCPNRVHDRAESDSRNARRSSRVSGNSGIDRYDS
jgi:hypothetical protein